VRQQQFSAGPDRIVDRANRGEHEHGLQHRPVHRAHRGVERDRRSYSGREVDEQHEP